MAQQPIHLPVLEVARAAKAAFIGVTWGGMGDEPCRVPSEAEWAAARADRDARRAAYARDPRGQFLAALAKLRQNHPKHEAASWRAHDAWARGFSDSDRLPIVGEVACAQLALNNIDTDEAKEARACLAEILIQTSRKAA